MHAISISTFAAALMGTVVTAQTNNVTDLFLIGFDYDSTSTDQAPFVGSIIASDATATTYSIACGSKTAAPATTSSYLDNTYDCGVPSNFTFTQGPSTIAYTYTISYVEDSAVTDSTSGTSYAADQATMTFGCVLSGSSTGICSYTEFESLVSTTFTSVDATTVSGTEYAEIFTGVPVTITAGPATTTSSASGASASASKSGSGSAAGSASGSATSTGGMPMITAKAQWVVGGVAAAMVMAAL
ncbi:putative gpi anchored protein [Botrytis fragariae]|uniref:Putative gpi anchored protein n=1 Tax=Botrytis fragariae TaxID=1964551 RepID=A0A8H6AP08_9HELO|nr:putative gpi anchored protein [Botrytis fragariae]KAF5870770.1 putative gpi anchored protein [Botrytis fragariae]